MNGNCNTCDVEEQCAYQYKPCDCCNYRKFKPKPDDVIAVRELFKQSSQVIQFPKEKQ